MRQRRHRSLVCKCRPPETCLPQAWSSPRGSGSIPNSRYSPQKLARRTCLTQCRGRCAYVYGAAVPLLTDTLRGGSTLHGTRRRIYRINFGAILTVCGPLPVPIFSGNAIDARCRRDRGELPGHAEYAADIDYSSVASIAPTCGRSRVSRARKGYAAVAYSRGSVCLSMVHAGSEFDVK